MKDFVRKHKIFTVLAAICALVLLSIAWDALAAVRGRFDARLDLAFGHYKVLGYGLPGPEREEYVRLLRTRHGIEFKKLADCLVSESLVDYANAYNAVSVAVIQRKFGRDVLQNSFEDAQRSWLHRPDKPASWQAVKYLFSYIPDKAHSVACLRAFSPGDSMYKIAEKCGRPDEEIGTDAYVFVYHLSDSSSVIIRGPYLRRVDSISLQRFLSH